MVDWVWWIGQSVGFLGLLLGLNAFRQKSDLSFKRHMTVFCIVESVHFAIMSAWSAGFGCLINGCRAFASTRTRSKTVMVFFLLVLWSVGLVSLVGFNLPVVAESFRTGDFSCYFKEPFRFLPLIGSTIGTIGLFILSGINLRMSVFLCSSLWLIHNIFVVSIGPSIMEVSFLIMNYRTIRKLIRDKRNGEKS